MDQPHHNREGRDCKHFVMRQYALDMRERDGKKCLALDSDGEIEQPLPPMVVPNYKYWYCQNCINGNGAVSSLEDIAVFCRCCESEMISETISSPSPPNNEMGIVRSAERTIVEYGTVGRGVLSLLSAEENKIFHRNQRRNYNRYAAESSVSHKSTTGPSVDESLKNVMDKFSHRNVEVPPPPSNKNVPVVQNLDISQLRNANVIALPKATEKRIMPWLQTEFPTTHPDLAPTSRNNLNNGQLKNNQSLSIFDAFPQSQCKASSVGEFSALGTIRNRNWQGSSETGRSCSPRLSSDQMPFAHVGNYKSPIVPAVSKSCSDQIGSLTLGGPTFMKGISGFMKDQPRTDICTKNVNPADFSYPNARNPFMISGAQLKVRKRAHSRGKTVKENENGGKKQKGNERAQHRPT